MLTICEAEVDVGRGFGAGAACRANFDILVRVAVADVHHDVDLVGIIAAVVLDVVAIDGFGGNCGNRHAGGWR